MYANNDSRSHTTCPTQPHSKQFQGREEFLFNNAFNTFDLLLYHVRYMVKDHWQQKKTLLSPLYEKEGNILFDGALDPFYMASDIR